MYPVNIEFNIPVVPSLWNDVTKHRQNESTMVSVRGWFLYEPGKGLEWLVIINHY